MTKTNTPDVTTIRGWTAYRVTIQRTYGKVEWTRFAPDAVHLVAGVQAACRENGWDDAVITDYRKTKV